MPTVDIDLLCVTADACQLALDLVAVVYEAENVAQARADLTTMRDALAMQVDYGERGVQVTVKPRVGVFRTARGAQCDERAKSAWLASYPYDGPTAPAQFAEVARRCGIDLLALMTEDA